MNYDDFKELILRKIHSMYENRNVDISISSVTKNNNVCLDAVSIKFIDEENKIVPVIYLNSYYERFQAEEMTIDEIVNAIIDLRMKNSDPGIDLENVLRITEWNHIKDFVLPRLISSENNDSILQSCINKSFLDLSIIYAISIMNNCLDGFGSVKITKDLFSHYNISEQQLYEQAIINLKKQGYYLRDIADVIAEFTDPSLIDDFTYNQSIELESGRLYVVGNFEQSYGASVILNPELLNSGKSFWVIPSSVHELLILPYNEDDDTTSQEDLDEMIKSVNTTINPEEVLSSHSYFYDGKLKELVIRRR